MVINLMCARGVFLTQKHPFYCYSNAVWLELHVSITPQLTLLVDPMLVYCWSTSTTLGRETHVRCFANIILVFLQLKSRIVFLFCA